MFVNELIPAEIYLLEQIGKVRRYKEGEFVIREGQTGSSFFLITSGRVEVRKGLGGGKHRKLVELGECDMLGEMGFLGVVNRSASVVALDEAVLIEFERGDFEELLQQEPMLGLKVYRGMAQELARRLAHTDEEIKDTILWALGEAQRESAPAAAEGEAPSLEPGLRPRLKVAPRPPS